MSNLITEVDILDEMKDCFLTYSEEVLTDRAIPSAEDGLLSVQRKLLWTMEDFLKMNGKGKTKKSASIVGSTLATSYFHGDTSCYGAMCKMAQTYLMRYPLVDGVGNFGSQSENGTEAAARYCVTGDTLIPTEKGMKTIKEIAKDVAKNSEKDIKLYVRGKDGEKVLAEKIVNSGEQDIYSLTLKNKQQIHCTINHPLLTLNKNLGFEWKTVEELKIGDKILYPLFKENTDIGFGKCNDLYEAAMLGCMISEGYATTQNRIGINNKDMDMIYPVMKWIALNWGENLGCLHENKKRGYFEYSVASAEHYPVFVSGYEFEKSVEKKLPKAFFEGTKQYQSILLSYLFEGDGSVDIEHGISYSSISEKLIRQLQLVLQMNFGIFSSILYSNRNNEIKLRINNASAERFLNQINFVSERKRNQLKELVEVFKTKRWANNNLQCLQEINSFLRKKYPSALINRYNFSHLKNIEKIRKKISEEDYNKIITLLNNYISLEIVDIEKKEKKEEVFCFTINNEDHAFIGNGLINHNTNARPSVYADQMMIDYKKNVVPTKETYNGEFYEPVVLPALFPNALVNGREAIGISMSHNSLPMNLTEVCEGIIAYIKAKGHITTEELMEYIKGPDFPLENTVINKRDILTAFKTGRSATSLKVRGHYEIKGQKIIFTTIPYRTYRKKIKEQISKNIDELEKVLEDFSDESNVGQNKLVFHVKKGIAPEQVVQMLFALTDLQTSLSYNMNFIVNGTPKLCSLNDLIKAYTEHQDTIIIKTAEYDLKKAEERAHILRGLTKALSKLDITIEIIKTSVNKNAARTKLIEVLEIDEIQANAILDMKLSRITKLDSKELFDELKEKEALILKCKEIIQTKDLRDSILIQKITELKNKYGDARRTELLDIEEPTTKGKKTTKPKPAPVPCMVVLTETGNIKRIPTSSYKVQHRGGKGVKSQEDITKITIRTNTVDSLLVFSSLGKLYKIEVNDIPEGTNTARGTSLAMLVGMDFNEKVATIYSLSDDSNFEYVLFITKNGVLKKSLLSEYTSTRRKKGIAATKIKDNDELIAVTLLNDEDIILLTKNGIGIRIPSSEVRPMGKLTIGVRGIELAKDDYVVSALIVRDNNDKLAIANENGYGYKCKEEMRQQSRGGKGLRYSDSKIAGAAMVSDDDILLFSCAKNNIVIPAKELPTLDRGSKGNKLVDGGNIKSVSKI